MIHIIVIESQYSRIWRSGTKCHDRAIVPGQRTAHHPSWAMRQYFSIDFTGDMGIACQGEFALNVGLFPILVLDLDNNHNSGTLMKDAIDDWRVLLNIKRIIPEDITHYRTIFLCLGTYNTNHVLTSAQAAPFIEFLNNGGKLCTWKGRIPGITTRCITPPTLHPMFNIQGLSDGSGDLSTLMGVAGTFVESFMYYFGGR
jgi:hypothetical protein